MADWKDMLKGLADQMPPMENEKAEDRPATEAAPAGKRKGTLHIVTERKGRGGKTATIVCDFPEEMTDEEIESLGKRIKQKLGTGGSARGGEILIQGERRADVAALLRAEGWTVKG